MPAVVGSILSDLGIICTGQAQQVHTLRSGQYLCIQSKNGNQRTRDALLLCCMCPSQVIPSSAEN